jgi:hypothetical protein
VQRAVGCIVSLRNKQMFATLTTMEQLDFGIHFLVLFVINLAKVQTATKQQVDINDQ